MSQPREQTWYRLGFPADLELDSLRTGLLELAAERRGRLLSPVPPLVFELELSSAGCDWRLGGDRRRVNRLLPGLRRAVDGLSLVEMAAPARVHPARAVELRLRSQERPLSVEAAPVLAGRLLGLHSQLRGQERLLVQWSLGSWLPRTAVKPVSAQSKSPAPFGFGGPVLDTEQIQAARRKRAEPVIAAAGRLAVWASDARRARSLLHQAVGSYQVLRAPGAGFVRRSLPSWWVASSMRSHSVGQLDPSSRLMVSELAACLAWPLHGLELPGLAYQRARLLPADVSSLKSEAGLRPTDRVIGLSSHPERPGNLVLPVADAMRHLHIVGPTGVGKSWLLANLILSDIAAGRGVVVIDPKEDLVNEVLARLPEAAGRNLVLLDPTDPVPVGINPLSAGGAASAELAVDGLVHVLHSLWASSWGPRLSDVLHAGLLTLARAGGHSLPELPLLLTDAGFRRRIVPKLAAADPVGLGSFWAWYEALSEEARGQVLAPVMNKLRAFVLRPELRAVLGQASPRFQLSQVFTERTVLLVRLGRGSLGSEGAQLLGSLLMASLWQVIQGRSRVAKDKRLPTLLYLDEFQDFLRLNIELGDALVQARGLAVGLTLAHQNLKQLDGPVGSALLANAGSRVVFGLDHDDAVVMARRSQGQLQPEDFMGLAAYEAYARVLVDGSPGRYASIRTRPLTPASRDIQVFEAGNRERYGVSRAETEAALHALVAASPKPSPPGFLGARPEGSS